MAFSMSAWAQERNPQSAVDSLMRSGLHVDPASGAMQMQIPLGEYRGRGGASLPLTISYSSKLWTIKHLSTITCSGEPMSVFNPEYSKGSAAGWTSSLGSFGLHQDLPLEYYDQTTQQPSQQGGKEIARIYVNLPDGSRHELRRDDIAHNKPDSRTGVYYSVDGSRLKYDRTADILYLPDGSRYLNFQQTNGVIQYVDRNGNTLTYNSGYWNDALGRSIGGGLPGGSPGDYPFTLPGFNGSTMTYTFKWRNLGDVLTNTGDQLHYKGDTPNGNCIIGGQQPNNLFSTIDSYKKVFQGAVFNPVVLSEIVLPNGRSYLFTYNVYGEISKIVYPTGGTEVFGYGAYDPLGGQLDEGTTSEANRGVVSRVINDGGTSQTWTYGSGTLNDQTAIRTVTAPDGTSTQIFYYKGRGADIEYGFDDARAGMATEERVYNSSGTMLRRTLYQLAKDGPQGAEGYATATRNARVTKRVDIILDTGGDAMAAATEMAYDADLNLISTKRYDYNYSITQSTAQTGDIASIPNGTPLRTEEIDYGLSSDANYRARNLISLPTATRVKDGNENIVAQSSIAYDETSLQSIGSTTGWVDPQTSYRGNPTTMGTWLNTTNTYLSSHATYDQFGNVRTATDAKGNQSQLDYSSTYNYAYATTATTAIPDSTGQHGSTSAFVTTSVFDINTGLVKSTKDEANNVTTTFDYADSLNRLTRTVRASGTALASQTTIEYDDEGRSITTTSDQNTFDDSLLKSEVIYDALGRKTESRQYETASAYITVKQEYDALGRAYKVSNPYRSGDTIAWTTTAFDALGRVISVTTPTDNAVVATSYSGNRVLVTDQAGKQRISTTDGLGRLTDVWEVRAADPPATETLSFPGHTEVAAGYRTSYQYDTLDNLTTVNQGSQTRSFVYDSLKRLTSASNPESGTNSYQYDNNGNLTLKTDSRLLTGTQTHVAIAYDYDALNRVKTRTYNDGTPAVSYVYDTLTNGKGRLTSTSSGVSSYTYGNYDAMGQSSGGTQTIGSQNYYVGYTYDLAGHVTAMTYPSGHTVNYNYDNSGRLGDKDSTHLAFTGNLGDGTTRTYSTGVSYSSFGGMSKEQFGTNTAVYHKLHYNVRGQLYDVRASTVNDDLDWNRGAIVNYYSLTNYGFGLSGTDNNGNLYVQQTWIPDGNGGSAMVQQNYQYDALNRLTWVGEYQNGQTATAAQSYSYDRFGNKTTSGSWNLPYKSFAVDPNTNRLGVPSGQTGVMIYDAPGNLKTDTYSGSAVTRAYDAENRMTSEIQANSYEAGTYSYDGDGRRIKRKVGGVETWQVYGMGGELLAEYAENAPYTSPQKEYGYRNGELLVTAEGSPAQTIGSTPNAATFVSQQVPATMTAGHHYAVSVTFRNSGSNTWTTANHYNLGVANDNGVWGLYRVALPSSVAPNQEVTFNFTITAPTTATNYNFQWRVVQDYVEWFGDYSTNVQVAVSGAASNGGNASECTWQNVPSTMVAGQSYSLTVKMLNTGTNTWTTANQYNLGSANDNGAWGLYRVALPSSVSTNQEATLTFTVIAPATPGAYNFQWRMVQDTVEWFGDVSTNVAVTVTAPSSSTVHWLVTDQLGTPRMIFDQTGSLSTVSRHDYLPFGEELFAGTGGRTTGQGYTAGDNVRQKFTQKERDNETGLDYFLARYYSSTQGRFTSADEFASSAHEIFAIRDGDDGEKQALAYADVFSPQSLNKYQYCLNNPLRYIDPDGHDWRIVEEKDRDGKLIRRYVWDRNYTYKKGDKDGAAANAHYIDTQGRAIQLWGDNKKDPKNGADHGYQVAEVTKQGTTNFIDQKGEAPTSFATYGDTVQALQNAGYREHNLDFYPEHWLGHDFSKTTSPTLHVTVFTESNWINPPLDERRVSETTFHVDKHTQAGTWKDLGRHLKDVTKDAIGIH